MGSIVTITENETAIIPLYSVKGGIKIVYPKSGLNQWNAGGRPRSIDEVYIHFNKEIREKYGDFFRDRKSPFNVTLPNGKTMSMKLCQDEGKALMSNPNSELGEWLLREVLRLEENELLTYEKLEELGVESVLFEKNQEGLYKLDFIKLEDETSEESVD